MIIDYEKENTAAELLGSLLGFTKFFFKHITGREFIVSQPLGRESHHITICRQLTRAFNLELPTHRLIINVPPGHAKSTLLCMWVCWAFAHYPDCRFLYISYSADIATRQTEFIKRIMSSQIYRYLFGVQIRPDSKAKSNFMTTDGGVVAAFGSAGSIVGVDAGYPNLDRFSGAVLCDDLHKIEEVHSDNLREGVKTNFQQTILQRLRGHNVPIIAIGQRTHENDIFEFLHNKGDGYDWETIVLKAIDESGNALYPEAFPKEMLLKKQETDPYTWAAQFMQNPVSAGNALFQKDWFVVLEEEPEFICTFITADTAESSKSWADSTVFSFWGVYDITTMGRKTGQIGLHWISCEEHKIEPKDLQDAFLDFYAACSTHPKPPLIAAIEKKSTGITLVSVLKELRGMTIRSIERTRASGSKTQRFLETQPYVASKRVSFTRGAIHYHLCTEHVSKINAANTHRRDDIADTMADAVKIALIEKSLYNNNNTNAYQNQFLNSVFQEETQKRRMLGTARYGDRK
jgi:hypothetical protein